MDRVLPVGTLPATNFPPSTVLDWCDADDEHAYRAARGRSPYGEHDIQYTFNALGYRCAEFDADAEIRVLTVGCSYVMGIGLPQSHLFHEQFASRLRAATGKSVVLWNLAIPGASNDYIARLLFLGVPLLDPHLVLVHFTHGSRREYISVQNRLVPYAPSFRPPDMVRRAIWKHFDALTSPFDDALNLFRNYKAIESLLGGRGWLFSTIEPAEVGRLAPHLQMHRFAGHMTGPDVARDGVHPGPRSHEALAEAYWARYTTLQPVAAPASPPSAATSTPAPGAAFGVS